MDSDIKTFLQQQHGFIMSKVIFTACELGVFDLLMTSQSPLTAAAIAERLGTSQAGTERLLDACVGLKLLRVERKENTGFYGNEEVANLCLAKSSPKSQYNFMKLHSEYIYPSMQYLADAVREGKSQIQSIHGPSSKNIFDALYSSKEMFEKFMNAMDDTWSLYGREVLSAFNLSDFPHICDVGGAGGTLAKECISLYPKSTVTMFDLPEVIGRAKENFVCPEESQIVFQEGDFFKDPVPEANLYVLARVLHDWDDGTCVQLLTKLHKACKPGGGVLVVEIIFNEDKTGPLEAHLYSILMLLLTEGKERTISEYSALFNAAGFKKMEAKKGNLYTAILGKK
ncbi:acetylserotonin O-methyltransferase-like isoform X1 [Varanus komodoensis]|uniref:Acetylserotonin O-methyltransferase n=1 Tax=Varanus komodoensis TaxID=61221 RepID=A0A8D2JI65_VARKO|nr:acetylserotonin O-methyltransferase-like isoform X1 [Varanus komodoensis]